MVFWIFAIITGVAATICAVVAAYVYLRPGSDRLRAERLARRWLLATAVLGFSAIALRFLGLALL